MSEKAGLRQRKVTLVAGDMFSLPAQGNYLRLVSSLYPVLVELNDNDFFNLSPGEDVIYPVDQEFSRLNLYTTAPGNDDVVVMVGKNVRVSSAKVSGAVTISGTPSVSVSGSLSGIASDVVQAANAYTTAFKSQATPAANGNIEILAPGANVNGVEIVRLDSIMSGAAAFKTVLTAKSSAPVDITDGDILAVGMPAAVNTTSCIVIDMRLKIAAGLGLYLVTSANTTSSSNNVSALLKVL